MIKRTYQCASCKHFRRELDTSKFIRGLCALSRNRMFKYADDKACSCYSSKLSKLSINK